MDSKKAVKIAKNYVRELLADEAVTNLGIEETEHDSAAGRWTITVGFSRPWNTPRTRAQEVLETLDGLSSLRRSFRNIKIAEDGEVISLKNRAIIDAID
jgi:uncharacterized protein YdeI (YjbR/CyaY-like superfamily)